MQESAGPSLPLPDVAVWSVGVRAAGRGPARPWAELVHAGLGPALRARGCALDCGDDPCRLGAGCAFDRCHGPNRERTYRLDATDLGPGGGALRLVSLASPDEGLLLTCLPEVLRPHRATHLTPLCHGGDDPAPGPLDLGARARVLTGEVAVELRSLCSLKREQEPVTHPTVLDLLHAARLRTNRLGLDVSAFPVFEDEVALIEEDTPRPGVRLHHNRHGARPIPGVLHRVCVHLSPAQAAWLALAEVVGVGGKTALGFGVVRGAPLEGAGRS